MTQQTNGNRIRLRVAFRNMFYTTIYAAVEGGFLAAEGLDVDFSHIPTGQSSTDLLKSGDIDITQSGISRSFMDLDAGSDALRPCISPRSTSETASSCCPSNPPTAGPGLTSRVLR